MKKFSDFNWELIAKNLNGRLSRSTKTEAEIRTGYGALKLIDMKGEVLVYKVSLLQHTVPYREEAIGDLTMAYRLRQLADGNAIDFNRRLETAEEGDDG